MQARNRAWIPGWNIAAFLHSTGWFWYRRMYAWSILNLLAPLFYVLFITLALRPIVPDEQMGHAIAASGIAYLLLVFVLVPVFADSLYLAGHLRGGKVPKPPSAFTAIGAVLIIVVPAYVAWVTAQAQVEYARRDRASEGLNRALLLREPVAEFHANERRLPGPQEAAKFRETDPMKFTRSVAWDAGRRAIVITLGERDDGKRYELAAVEKDGRLEWICRTIDFDPKYLRSSCR
jgi:hypothetical protein